MPMEKFFIIVVSNIFFLLAYLSKWGRGNYPNVGLRRFLGREVKALTIFFCVILTPFPKHYARKKEEKSVLALCAYAFRLCGIFLMWDLKLCAISVSNFLLQLQMKIRELTFLP